MQIPVLIERTADRRFIATGSAPFTVQAEADTADEALEKVKQMIDDRVATGATIASVDLSGPSNAWLAGAGMFAGDALFVEWQRAIVDNRCVANSDAESQ